MKTRKTIKRHETFKSLAKEFSAKEFQEIMKKYWDADDKKLVGVCNNCKFDNFCNYQNSLLKSITPFNKHKFGCTWWIPDIM